MILSIIIPVYNVEKYLSRCIDSCINQDLVLGDYEIIIVNDGSTDNSLAIAEKAAGQDSSISIVSQNNKGLSGARNTGLKNAKGKYVWFVDSDDWISKGCLKSLSDRLEQCDVDILGICKANVIGEEIQNHYFYNDQLENIVLSGQETLKNGLLKNVCSPYSIYKRSFLLEKDLHFYEGIFHEDNEFTPRAYYLASKVGFYNKICYYAYQRPNSITTTINPKRSFDMLIVAQRLSIFAENVRDDCLFIFHNYISNLINESLHLSKSYKKKDKKRLSNTLFQNKNLFVHLKKSNRTKYNIEGWLFTIFPKQTIFIYKFLSLFKLD